MCVTKSIMGENKKNMNKNIKTTIQNNNQYITILPISMNVFYWCILWNYQNKTNKKQQKLSEYY